jgi:hypothetical protein
MDVWWGSHTRLTTRHEAPTFSMPAEAPRACSTASASASQWRRTAPAQCRHCRTAQATNASKCNSGRERPADQERASLVQSQSGFVTSLSSDAWCQLGHGGAPEQLSVRALLDCVKRTTGKALQTVVTRRRYSLAGAGRNRDRRHCDDLVGGGDSSSAPGVNLLAWCPSRRSTRAALFQRFVL